MTVAVESRGLGKIAVASVVGTSIEYYDFILAGVASTIIWPSIFYPESSPALALFFAVGSYALGLAVRPIGGFIFGHLGDRYGRKAMLVWTLVAMGLGTIAIALTPGYASIGIAGGVLIYVWRTVQGLGIGGEWGSAATWITEHSSTSRWRSVWSNWVNMGIPFGLISSYGTFLVLEYTLSPSALFNWGWRLAYIISAIIIVLGVIIRYRLQESPLFNDIFEKKQTLKSPIGRLFREQWKKVILLTLSWSYIISLFYVAVVFAIGYDASPPLKVSPNYMITAIIVAGIIAAAVQVIGAISGDKIGRKRVVIIGALALGVFSIPFWYMMSTGDTLYIIIAEVIFNSLLLFGFGPLAAFFAEQFPTSYRNSGVGISYQLGALPAGIASTLAPLFFVIYGHGSWLPIGIMSLAYCVVSAVAAGLSKETIKTGVTE